MLVAKFVPGLTTIVPPLAGIFAIGRARFAIYEVGGVLLWAGTWMGLGYFFSDAITSLALSAARLGRMLGIVVVAVAGGYILVKYLRRRLFLQRLRMGEDRKPALGDRHDGPPSSSAPDLVSSVRLGGPDEAI